jgi:hypothetical protein
MNNQKYFPFSISSIKPYRCPHRHSVDALTSFYYLSLIYQQKKLGILKKIYGEKKYPTQVFFKVFKVQKREISP